MTDTSVAGEVDQIEIADLVDFMYGGIQSMIERGSPDNVVFHYFLPAIPFGPELGAFMDLGSDPKPVDPTDEEGEKRFTVSDMLRSAVNFAAIADYIPAIGSDPVIGTSEDSSDTVDLNALIASGKRVSSLYEAVLRSAKVIDNKRSPDDEKKLKELRALLYKEPPPPPPEGAETTEGDGSDDDLIAALSSDGGDVDTAALLGGDLDAGDFVDNPDELAPPTRLMQLYQATETLFYQVQSAELEKVDAISANDPNQAVKIRAAKSRIEAARRRWETQGRKAAVEQAMARIAQLEQGGMPQYIDSLRRRMEGNRIGAAVTAGDEGVSLVVEEAFYTALRPNGILTAPSQMRVSISNSERSSTRRFQSRETSGRAVLPIAGVSLLAAADGSKVSRERESEFAREEFSISFEIVQGIIDRPWFDLAFIESPAYTTAEPGSGKPLDAMLGDEILLLSDGELPPTEGHMKAVPMTVYFVRDLVVRSSAFARLSESERERLSGKAGVTFLGFGAKGEHTSATQKSSFKMAESVGELRLDGQFLVAMASRFVGEAPRPDFDAHPPSDWI